MPCLTLPSLSAVLSRRLLRKPRRCVAPLFAGKVELLAQGAITVAVWVAAGLLVGALPRQKRLVERISFLLQPEVELLVSKRRTQLVVDEHSEQVDLALAAPAVCSAQCAGVGARLDGGLLSSLFTRYTLLKYADSLIYKRAAVAFALDYSPADRVRTQIESQYLFHNFRVR